MGEAVGAIITITITLIVFLIVWISYYECSINSLRKFFRRIFSRWEKWEIIEEDNITAYLNFFGEEYKRTHHDVLRRRNKYTGMYQYRRIKRRK